MESVTAKPTLKPRTIWILAAAITVLDFLVAALTSEMSYMMVDDGSIQNVFSGVFTGSPYPIQQYINVVLSYPITGLYRLFPNLPWWYIWYLAATAVGIFLIHLSLLKLSSKNRVFLPVVFGTIAFLDIGFFIYAIANITFTIVPAILGAGMAALLFSRAEEESVRFEKWVFAGSLVGYILLFCTRRQSGLVLLCFILLAFLYYYVSRDQDWKRKLLRIVLTFAVFILTSVALTQVNRAVQNAYQPEGFNSFNSARSAYLDYPHDSFEENPELYEEAGWDYDIYLLANSWCFLPEEVNTETFSYLSENSSDYTSSDMLGLMKEVYRDKLSRSVLMLYLASILIALYVWIACRSKKNLLFWLISNIGAIALIFYQFMIGRAPYRSLYVVLLPAVVINLLLSFNREMRKKSVRIGYGLLVLAMGVICVVPMMRTTFDREHRETVAAEKEKETRMREYRAEHPDNVYIRQISTEPNIDPLYNGPDAPNSYGWGGGVFYSASYDEFLAANGLTELNGDTFKEDNVYLIAGENVLNESYHDDGTNTFAALLRYLEKECGAVGFVHVDRITGGAHVYQFVFEENEDEFDTYYDIVDGYAVEAGS